MSPKPGWTEGLGELIRAHRRYTGLSQRTFADKCGIREKSYSDIEIGRRDTPDGFLDTVERVLTDFDAEVDQVIRAAQARLAADGESKSTIHFRVSDRDEDEWVRAVIGRAAVTSGLIVPILDGTYQREDRAG